MKQAKIQAVVEHLDYLFHSLEDISVNLKSNFEKPKRDKSITC